MDQWDAVADLRARLDRYEARLRAVEELEARVVRIEERVDVAAREASACNQAIQDFEKRQVEAATRARDENLKGRRWIIGSIIAASGVIVGAVALIIDTLSGAPT